MGKISPLSAAITQEEEKLFRERHGLGEGVEIAKPSENLQRMSCGRWFGVMLKCRIYVPLIASDAESYLIEHLGSDWENHYHLGPLGGQITLEIAKNFVAVMKAVDECEARGDPVFSPPGPDGVSELLIDATILKKHLDAHGLPS